MNDQNQQAGFGIGISQPADDSLPGVRVA